MAWNPLSGKPPAHQFFTGTELPDPLPPRRSQSPLAEARAEELDNVRELKVKEIMGKMSPSDLEIWLRQMPKGGDLHLDFACSVSAEWILREAIDKKLFYDPHTCNFSETIYAGCITANQIPEDPVLLQNYYGAYTTKHCGEYNSKVYDHLMYGVMPRRYNVVSLLDATKVFNAIFGELQCQNVQYAEMLATQKTVQELVTKYKFEQVKTESNKEFRFHIAIPRNAEFLEELVKDAFELLNKYPQYIVGVNLVGPEADFKVEAKFPKPIEIIQKYWDRSKVKPKLSLQAGELTDRISTTEQMSYNLRYLLQFNFFARFTHGISITKENKAINVMASMAKKNTAIELPLTGHELLGVTPKDHSVHSYRKAGVPIVLCSGRGGVTRDNLTTQYYKAVREYGFNYLDVKKALRCSLEYSFLEGDSIFANSKFELSPAFEGIDQDKLVEGKVSIQRAMILKESPKAARQYDLEIQLVEFENQLIEWANK